MPSFLQSLFPCFAGGDDQQHPQDQHPDQLAKPKEAAPRTSSNTSTIVAPVPVSEAPAAQKPPLYRPDTDKKLPPQPPSSELNAIELPGSQPNLFEMPATHVPASHPLARASNATSADLPRPSHHSEQAPHSPHSVHSTLPASAATSTHQPSASVRAPSERGDPDEISPVATNTPPPPNRGGAPNMYVNVADALTDRKRMFERLRKANGVEQQQQGGQAQGMYAVTPVEMEAPMQQAAPSELAGREHVRSLSGPKELE